jgi:hypothetical protein
MTSVITTLLDSGMDAYSNLYDVQIDFPTITGITDSTYSSSVRAMGFQPPELSLGEYNVSYKGLQLVRPTPKITGNRTFTIEFRLDANYTLYNNLLAWKHIWVNPSGEGNIQVGDGDGATTPSQYGTIKVNCYRINTDIDGYSGSNSFGNAEVWTFYDVICSKVGTPNFQRAGTDPVTITSEFIFGRIIEPPLRASSFTSETPPTLSAP